MTDLVDLVKFISREIKDLQVQLKRIYRLLNDRPLKKWYDGAEVQQLLHISPRTLQTLRSTGEIPYSNIKGKFYYKVEDIDKLLESNYSKLSTDEH